MVRGGAGDVDWVCHFYPGGALILPSQLMWKGLSGRMDFRSTNLVAFLYHFYTTNKPLF